MQRIFDTSEGSCYRKDMRKFLRGKVSEMPPEELVQEILAEAKELVAKLDEETSSKLPPEKYQDAFISFSQVFLWAITQELQGEDREGLEKEIFLRLARGVLEEMLGREATEAEFDYFLTYYRSHFELLRRELSAQEELEFPRARDSNLEKYLSRLLSHLLAQEREVSH